VLRDRAIGPLLSVLADEEDGATRKALVELLSGLAADHIARIGEHILDPRWYFVRNVVTVLGAPRSPAALTYLGRTARHPDARVRRETIRALAGIPDRVASELLVTLLSDEDAQNVQLAARHLGQGRVRGAVPVLMQVARGEGRGNRDLPARLEAIEALGQIGSDEALNVLSSLARRRGIMGGSRDREIRAAAQGAASRIRAQGGVR
jgi:HEAT repeat protein